MKAVIADCADRYDIVVIDLPPLLSVADGLIIGRYATANFLAVKAGEQKLKELRVTVDRMHQSGIDLAGFVFNDLTRMARSYTYGRYAKPYQYAYHEKGKGK